MTTRGNQSAGLAPIRVDRIDLAALAAGDGKIPAQGQSVNRFWVSGQRGINSDHREIMEVSFGSERLVNHLAFEVSRFPLVLRVEYLDTNGDWQGVTYAKNNRRGPRREVKKDPVRLVIAESVPGRIDSAQIKGNHHSHFGKGHWMRESWKVRPVRTRKLRFIFTRNALGKPPLNHHGQKVPYSVALRGLVVGYRVINWEDIPRTEDPWWASSRDILNGQVVYSTYDQPAERVIDGDRATYWRSEPQPFPFAVVNMFLDMRSPDGVQPVIDRFWIDPVTTGVLCNLYFSDDDPIGGQFEGTSEPIPQQFRTETGSPEVVREAQSQRPYALDFGPNSQTGVEISDIYARVRFDQPWWIGIDAHSLVEGDSPDTHPILSLGPIQLTQDSGSISLISPSGLAASIPLDPELHGLNTRYRIVASYHPADPVTFREPYFRLAYTIENGVPQVAEVAVTPPPNVIAPIRVGLHPDPESDLVSAMSLHGAVVKAESLTPETEDWFLDEGEKYLVETESIFDDRQTSQNAALRLHPSFLDTGTNLFGVVGGTGSRFDEMEWTPIFRDYTLRQGYMHLPPIRAKYWKFEMTGLLPQVYENFLTIDRDVLVFPPDVISAHRESQGLPDDSAAPMGSTALGDIAPSVAYTDALQTSTLDVPTGDETKVLVVRDPQQAEQISGSGWIWNYQPWHIGTSAPQFMRKQVHRYQSVAVRHKTKVGYFAGIREIQPFRVDYSFDDDTPEYVEHLLDFEFIDEEATGGLATIETGGVRATAANAEITSVPMLSYRTVRGVQFATQETDAVQVLTDSDFSHFDLSMWPVYGDATVDRLGVSDVLVTRGWFFNTYADLEAEYPTYGDMDGVPYALLEGNNQPTGYAEGGLESETYSPSGSGKILGMVKVSASTNLSAPITVDLVSSYDDRVVATATKWVRTGEAVTMTVGYAPGAVLDRRTYGEVEELGSDPALYGELETYKYFELEAEGGINSDLYLRVRQQGPTDDSFHIHRMALYDSPVAWFFSNDGGENWWQAIDVRNNPHGVLLFPESLDEEPEPEFGRSLLWKARIYKENAVVTALHIRPWYGSRSRTVSRAHGLDSLGPNQSMRDLNPATHQHPMWQPSFNPVEKIFEPVEVVPFWRNLAINPGGEIGTTDGWSATSGTLDAVTWDENGEVVVL